MTRSFLFLLSLGFFSNAIANTVKLELPSEQLVIDYTCLLYTSPSPRDED